MTLSCWLVRIVLVSLPVLLLLAVLPAGADTTELGAQLRQLRQHYIPYLCTVPKPNHIRRQTALPGAWRWKMEVDDFAGGPRPPAPDWYRVDLDDSTWQTTTVPEWRYDKGEPFGSKPDPRGHRPESRIAWYRTSFAAPAITPGQRVFLTFAGVAWEAEVWLNGTKLGQHTAYWEPFRFEVTAHLRAHNVLAVRVLAGTNLGEPTFGWTVLPCALAEQPRYTRDTNQPNIGQRELFGFKSSCFLSGFGIHREAQLETTGAVYVSGLLARGDPRTGTAKIRVETDAAVAKSCTLFVQLLPENFTGKSFDTSRTVTLPQGQDVVTLEVPMPGMRRWQPEDPCLYRCRVTLREGRRDIDSQDTLFGCRSFCLVTAEQASADRPAGMFLLNDQPLYLRGADVSAAFNGFWYRRQQDKLIDAVLMLKAGHFNAIRACEHVQFPEVRELLDRLGMLSEQDQVGAGYSSTPMSTLAELSARLARLCYNNPGVILLTAGGSETNFDPAETVAAVLAVDPERVIKPISGHMDNWGTAYDVPPGYTKLPPAAWHNVVDDFHCYNGWYRRGVDMPLLAHRYPPARLVTVGEFGAEGLDAYTTMQRYPAHMQPPPSDTETLWGASQVLKGDPKLDEGFRGRQPTTLAEYITASQQYQADVLAEQATGFRLSPRRIGGYFVFHFIDGLPAEWQKSIVSFDLTPKRGYFALAQINQPVAPLFQIGDGGKTLSLWVANDRTNTLPGARLAWSVESGGKILLHSEERADVQPLNATHVKDIDLSALPADASVITIQLVLSEASGKQVSQTSREVFLPAWRPTQLTEQAPLKARVPLLADAGGDPRKVDWAHAAQLGGWKLLDGNPTKHVIDAKIAHDGHYLYLQLAEPVKSTALHNDEGIWGGDDWELFFGGTRGKPYRQVGVNPHGDLLDLPSDKTLPLCGAHAISDTAPERWTVYFTLPLDKLVLGGLKSGGVFYGNLCRQAGGGDTYRDYLAWSPNYSNSFHQPERFSEFTLE